MRAKKLKAVLLGLGLGFAVLGVALFFIVPFIGGSDFSYNSLGLFTDSLKTLVSFNFGNVGNLLVFILLVSVVAFFLIWLITICVRKEPRHLIAAFAILIFGVLIDTFLAVYFVVPAELNGTKGKLISLVMGSSNILGKLLSVAALVLIYASAICLVLFAFIDLVVLFNKKSAVEAAESSEEPKEEEEKPVSIETIVQEQKVEEAVIQENPLEGYEDRKAREEAFFKACLATGEFEQFDEVDLENPIECEEEEPIFEVTEIEEEDEKIQRHNFVTISTKRTVSIK